MTWRVVARSGLSAVAIAALVGCASIDPYAAAPISAHLQRDDAVGECARLLRDADAHVDATGRRDAQAPRVAGFPYLRVSRGISALRDAAAAQPEASRFMLFSAPMMVLDRRARAAELRNAATPVDAARIDECREHLRAADAAQFDRLADKAKVPDDYSTALRVLGLYPLTRLAFAAGIRGWHERTRAVFAMPVENLPREGQLRRYVPAPQLLDPLATVPIGPAIDAARLQGLVLRHAPILDIDVASDDDRPGSLYWRQRAAGALIDVDTQRPSAYVRTAWAQIGGRWHLQLVYAFWFGARPAEHAFDVLAGHLDAVLWRVTLDADGRPLVYDSIHACGCYHQFFPTARVAPRELPLTLDESLFAPQALGAVADDERIVLRIAARTHYLQRVIPTRVGAQDARIYLLQADERLRALPYPGGGTRSAYDPDGFIAGSERLERFFFWPMGIESAGQMRQWGRHATAFVGRRHFDDPLLFDAYFELR